MPIDSLPVSPNQVDSDAMRTKINELISDNSSVTVGDTPPTSPGEGDLWFDEGTASMYVYIASPTNAWIQTNPAGGGGSGGGETYTKTFTAAETKSIIGPYFDAQGNWATGQMITHNLNSEYLDVKFWISHNTTAASPYNISPTTYLMQIHVDSYLKEDGSIGYIWGGPNLDTSDSDDPLNKCKFMFKTHPAFSRTSTKFAVNTNKGVFPVYNEAGVTPLLMNVDNFYGANQSSLISGQRVEITSSFLLITKYNT
jgi:hypothetical protein